MSDISSRADTLRAEHARLDEEIRVEQARPAADTLRIQNLKRQKLWRKEALDKLGFTSGKPLPQGRVVEVPAHSADIFEFPSTVGNGGDQVVINQRMVAVA